MSAGPVASGADRADADLFAAIPYAGFLGLRAERAADGSLRGVMPFSEHLIGNPVLPALHGGTLGALLELTAIAEVARRVGEGSLPRTIGVTIEYLRSGRPRDTLASAEVLRLGRRIANVHARAWQDDPDKPIALLQGRFLLPAAGERGR